MDAATEPAGLPLTIRPFRPEDLDPLYFLERRCHSETFRLPFQQLLETLLDPRVSALVAEVSDREERPLVGALVVQGMAGEPRLTLLTLMVDAPFRRAGIATRLLELAVRLAQAAGIAELATPLEADNAAGRAFLQAAGFAPAGEWAPYFPDGEAGRLWVCAVPAPEAEAPA